MTSAYEDDLAYVHDAGFGNFARCASAEVLSLLRAADIARGAVIELGCGSGISAEAISAAGYDVLGIDQSPAMLKLARRRAPRAKFRQESWLTAALPSCVAVTAIGEVFNYLFDVRNTEKRLAALFRRVYAALESGGLFVFDVALPGRGGKSGGYRNYTEGDDWACLFRVEEDSSRRILTRHITTFRQVEELYRRQSEVHRLRLLERKPLTAELRAAGFRVRAISGYGALKFPPGYVGFVARKP